MIRIERYLTLERMSLQSRKHSRTYVSIQTERSAAIDVTSDRNSLRNSENSARSTWFNRFRLNRCTRDQQIIFKLSIVSCIDDAETRILLRSVRHLFDWSSSREDFIESWRLCHHHIDDTIVEREEKSVTARAWVDDREEELWSVELRRTRWDLKHERSRSR